MLDPRDFGKLAYSPATAYPALLVFLALLIFSLIGFGEAAFAAGILRAIVAGFASLAFIIAVCFVAWAATFKPGLLRSADQELVAKVTDAVMADDSLSNQQRVQLLGQLRSHQGPKEKKPTLRGSEQPHAHGDSDG